MWGTHVLFMPDSTTVCRAVWAVFCQNTRYTHMEKTPAHRVHVNLFSHEWNCPICIVM